MNLFCLVKARKQLPSSYETEEEILIAHFQTQVSGDPSLVANQPPELKFYDITREFPSTTATKSEEMMQYAIVYDSCSFTIERTGMCILLLVSQAS